MVPIDDNDQGQQMAGSNNAQQQHQLLVQQQQQQQQQQLQNQNQHQQNNNTQEDGWKIGNFYDYDDYKIFIEEVPTTSMLSSHVTQTFLPQMPHYQHSYTHQQQSQMLWETPNQANKMDTAILNETGHIYNNMNTGSSQKPFMPTKHFLHSNNNQNTNAVLYGLSTAGGAGNAQQALQHAGGGNPGGQLVINPQAVSQIFNVNMPQQNGGGVPGGLRPLPAAAYLQRGSNASMINSSGGSSEDTILQNNNYYKSPKVRPFKLLNETTPNQFNLYRKTTTTASGVGGSVAVGNGGGGPSGLRRSPLCSMAANHIGEATGGHIGRQQGTPTTNRNLMMYASQPGQSQSLQASQPMMTAILSDNIQQMSLLTQNGAKKTLVQQVRQHGSAFKPHSFQTMHQNQQQQHGSNRLEHSVVSHGKIPIQVAAPHSPPESDHHLQRSVCRFSAPLSGTQLSQKN